MVEASVVSANTLTREAELVADDAFKFDAFISYSHAADGRLAPALQNGLERLLRPWYQLRSFHIFRDSTNLAVRPDLWNAIESSLSQARWLILMASPDAAASKWVRKEVEWWLEHRSIDQIILVLTAGTLEWDDALCNFSAEKSSALPSRLFGQFRSEPLWLNLTWGTDADHLTVKHVRFRSVLVSIAAALRGVDPDTIDGEAVATLKRNWISASIAVSLIVIAAAAAVLQAYRATNYSNQVTLQLDQRMHASLLESGRQIDGLHGAMQDVATARRILDSVPARTTALLWNAMETAREIEHFSVEGQVTGVSSTPDGQSIVTMTRHGEVLGWDRNGKQRYRWQASEKQFAAGLLPSGRGVIAAVENGAKIRLSDLNGHTLWQTEDPGWGETQPIDMDAAGTLVAVSLDRRSASVFAVSSGAPIFRLSVAQSDVTIADLRLSANGRHLAILLSDGKLQIFDVGRSDVPSVEAEMLPGSVLATDDDLGTLVTMTDATVKVWNHGNITGFPTPSPLAAGNAGKPSRPVVARSGRIAFVFENFPAVLIVEATGEPAFSYLRGADMPTVAFTKDGDRLITGDYLKEVVRTYDLTPRSARVLIPNGPTIEDGSREASGALAFCSQTGTIAWGGQNGTLRLVNRHGSVRQWPKAHDSNIVSIACASPDIVVTSSGDGGEVKLWQASQVGMLLKTLHGAAQRIVTLDDGRTLAGIAEGQVVRVWRLDGDGTPTEFAPGALTDGAISYVTGITAIPNSDTIVVTGQPNAGDVTMFASGWSLGNKPKLLWTRELPKMSNVWAIGTSPDGRVTRVAGTFDLAYNVDPAGVVRADLESVLRPGIWSFSYANADLFMAAGFLGDLALFTEGERLGTLPGRVLPPVVLAADVSSGRIYAADGIGRVSEIVFEPNELMHLACKRLQEPPAACTTN